MLLLWLFEDFYATLKTVTATFLWENFTKANMPAKLKNPANFNYARPVSEFCQLYLDKHVRQAFICKSISDLVIIVYGILRTLEIAIIACCSLKCLKFLWMSFLTENWLKVFHWKLNIL